MTDNSIRDKLTKKMYTTSDTTALKRKIDELVYKLYGLTDEEIVIVEGKQKNVRL